MTHAWDELGDHRDDDPHRVVKCKLCGVLALGIGGQYVSGEDLSTKVIFDGPNTRFVPGASPVGMCLEHLPVGTVVFHRSMQLWVAYELTEGQIHVFTIPVGARGVVVDEQGCIESTDEDGERVRLCLESYRVRDFWSMKPPKSVWDRLCERF